MDASFHSSVFHCVTFEYFLNNVFSLPNRLFLTFQSHIMSAQGSDGDDRVRVKRRDETTRHIFSSTLQISFMMRQFHLAFSFYFCFFLLSNFLSSNLIFPHSEIVNFRFSFSHILALVISSAFMCFICIISSRHRSTQSTQPPSHIRMHRPI